MSAFKLYAAPLLFWGLAAGCVGKAVAGAGDTPRPPSKATTTSVIKHVFVIAMENHDASQIYGNNADAPYINGTLVPTYAHATNFDDELAQSIPSEPHYVWMEAGTNTFPDRTFTTDADPSQSNSTSSTAHLTTQVKNAPNGVTWRTYQEGMNASTGACPIHKAGFYAPKHDPFVFFRDVAGSPPSATSPDCSAYHRPYGSLAGDLGAGDVASYTFITPNLCNDMHGASGCPSSNTIRAGDTWLSTALPRLIDYASRNAGVIFLTWDEGDDTCRLPFLAIGPGVKPGYAGSVTYNHSSLVKSIEQILNLPILSTVSDANDLSDLFTAGQYP
jgi:phosphatidylinositol-3-phosphatase